VAAFHYLTNKGKLLLLQGLWDDAGASAVVFGLLAGASIPTGVDTEAEIQDLNTVTELLAVASVDEPTAASYTRKPLSRSAVAEDDTNNRANLDAVDVVWSALEAGESVWGGFWYDATTDTNDTTRLLCGVFAFTTPLPLNGSAVTAAIADLVRAV